MKKLKIKRRKSYKWRFFEKFYIKYKLIKSFIINPKSITMGEFLEEENEENKIWICNRHKKIKIALENKLKENKERLREYD